MECRVAGDAVHFPLPEWKRIVLGTHRRGKDSDELIVGIKDLERAFRFADNDLCPLRLLGADSQHRQCLLPRSIFHGTSLDSVGPDVGTRIF